MKSRSFTSIRFASVLAVSLALLGMTAAMPATAKEESHRATKFPYASLQAEAVTEVARDMVRLTLAAEESNTAQAEVAAALTRKVNSVMEQVRGKEGIKVYSGNYQIWPMNDKDGRISDWRGRAEIILESADFEAVSKLAAEVADRMPIGTISFFVDPEARARYEAELLGEAAKAFQARSEALTKAFGFESYTIREVQLGGAGASYQPETRRMMAMSADMASAGVPLEGGTERISLSVQGTIFLHSPK